jgi:hypothetical protein
LLLSINAAQLNDCAAQSSGVFDFFEVQLFRDLLNPFLNALVGQLRLAVFINGQADEVIVIRQAFRGFKMIARCRPVANDGRAARLNDVADGAQRVAEVFCVVFLIAAAKQRNQFTVKVDLFQRREKSSQSHCASP